MKSFTQLKKNLSKDFSHLPKVKVALLGDFATQFLAESLQGYGYEQKLDIQLFEAEFNQIEINILNQKSDMYAFKPEFVILAFSAHVFQQKYYQQSHEKKETFAQDMIHHISDLYEQLQIYCSCPLVLNNFFEIDDKVFGSFGNQVPHSWLYQIRKLNFDLMNLARQKSNLYLNDVLSLQNKFGYQKVFDVKLSVLSTMDYSLQSLPLIAKGTFDIIQSLRGQIKKCVVLDLDNTLWGGIIGDAGIEGIQLGGLGLGRVFVEFQKWLLQLKLRGILLAVCSKNDIDIAQNVFLNHKNMVLKLEDVSCFIANWENKVDNMYEIQKTLNIGFDSMVFLDDSSFERNLVRENLPDVTVPELPTDPVEYLEYIQGLNLFETTSYTKLDSHRTESIRNESKRKRLRKSFTNIDEFLQSLNMQASLEPFNSSNKTRVSQLTQRSNQYNLRTQRYTESEITAISENTKYVTFALSLKDNLGDYGLISVAIGVVQKSSLFLDSWMMSCRVLQRGVEQYLLNEIVALAKSIGLDELIGEYLPTAKNALVREHYQKLKFERDGNFWKLKLAHFTPLPCYIKKTT